jgi:3-oxoacyl-[acyl-carrier protein] reductase
MELKLRGKKVLVTGGSKGLGLEIVRAFAEEQAIITMCARNSDNLEKAKASINVSDKQIFTCTVDATSEKDVIACIKQAVSKMGGLDILVNNVGGASKFAGFFDLEVEDWLGAYQLNVMSIIHFVKNAFPFLKKSQSPRIINISSLTGLQPGGFSPHYSTSKAACINLSKHLANILAKDRILVNCVIPGTFESEGWERNIQRVADEQIIAFEEAEQKELKLAKGSIPLGRIGVSKEITPVIMLLASEISSWTTGSCLVVDGGKIRSIH